MFKILQPPVFNPIARVVIIYLELLTCNKGCTSRKALQTQQRGGAQPRVNRGVSWRGT